MPQSREEASRYWYQYHTIPNSVATIQYLVSSYHRNRNQHKMSCETVLDGHEPLPSCNGSTGIHTKGGASGRTTANGPPPCHLTRRRRRWRKTSSSNAFFGAILLFLVLVVTTITGCLNGLPLYSTSGTTTASTERRLNNDGDSAYSQYVGYHSRNRDGGTDGTDNGSYYGYPEDQPIQTNWLAQKYNQTTTTIRDVWMCWLLAVAWGLWMFSSFVKSDLLRYGQDSITIRGNVRMVTRVEASLGTGIPIYKAVIDYIIPSHLCSGQYGDPTQYPPSRPATPAGVPSPVPFMKSDLTDGDADRPSLQIRKEFETLHPLQQGFRNVELLVLHHEPTTSIIKEDWEQQVMEEMEESRARRGTNQQCCGCFSALCLCMDEIFCGFGKDAYGERILWKRIWVSFCLLMMMLSMGGSVLAVHHLPTDVQRLGWLCLCLQSLLLLPTALMIRVLISSLQRCIIPEGRAGVVVNSNSASPENSPNAKKGNHPVHPVLSWGEEAPQNEARFCMDPSEVLDVQVCEEDEVYTLQQAKVQQAQNQAKNDEDYVVRVNNMKREDSDLSDMSRASRSVRLNPMASSTESNLSVDSDKTRTGIESGVMA